MSGSTVLPRRPALDVCPRCYSPLVLPRAWAVRDAGGVQRAVESRLRECRDCGYAFEPVACPKAPTRGVAL